MDNILVWKISLFLKLFIIIICLYLLKKKKYLECFFEKTWFLAVRIMTSFKDSKIWKRKKKRWEELFFRSYYWAKIWNVPIKYYAFLKEKGKKKKRMYYIPLKQWTWKVIFLFWSCCLCSNQFYFFWAFKNLYSINCIWLSNLYVTGLHFWSHLNVIESWGWLQWMIKLNNRFWLEMGQFFVPSLDTC